VLFRAIAALVCLLPVAWAQGLEEDINGVLDPRTGTERRRELLIRIQGYEGGLNQLAQRGLDGKLDVDVVHPIVEKVLASGEYVPHLPRICGLLLFDAHRERVLTRIQELGEDPTIRGEPLRKGLLEIAKGRNARDDPKLRGAAIEALGRVPRREVLKELIELGQKDAKVRAPVLKVVKQLGFTTLEGAEQYLRKHSNDSLFDIQRKKIAELRRTLEGFRELGMAQLRTASANVAVAAMDDSDAETRRVASTRLKQLAEKGEYGAAGAKEFAGRIFDLFVAERANPDLDGATLANLCATLEVLTRGGEEAPLWLARDRAAVVAALQPLATDNGRLSPKEALAVGSAAVSVLHRAGEAAAPALAAFARQFSHAAARKGAIQYLGDFARRFEPIRDYVGRILAGMLPTEKDAAVRRQILATLNQRFVPAEKALVPIRGFLQPKPDDTAPKLDDTEIRDCIGILGRIGSVEALALLREIARAHAELRVRRLAVVDGLLPWAARNGKEPVILKDLLALAVGKEQPLEARRAVIEALGQKGTRNAHPVLNVIVQTQGIDPALQTEAVAAKLALAERLAVPPDGRTITSDDLQAAIRILEEEKGAADLARLDKLARDIVRVGDAAKLTVGVARYRLVTLYLRRPEKKRETKALLDLYVKAAGKAAADGLPGPEEQALQLGFKTLLLDKTLKIEGVEDNTRVRDAIGCLRRAAKLEEGGDKKKAAKLFLDAAELAIGLKDKKLFQTLRNLAMGTEGVVGELGEREKTLRDQAAALPG